MPTNNLQPNLYFQQADQLSQLSTYTISLGLMVLCLSLFFHLLYENRKDIKYNLYRFTIVIEAVIRNIGVMNVLPIKARGLILIMSTCTWYEYFIHTPLPINLLTSICALLVTVYITYCILTFIVSTISLLYVLINETLQAVFSPTLEV